MFVACECEIYLDFTLFCVSVNFFTLFVHMEQGPDLIEGFLFRTGKYN